MKGKRSSDSSRATDLLIFLGGLLLGSLGGAVLMWLMAPGAGQKTRSQFQKQSAKLRRQTAESLEDVVGEAGEKAYNFTESLQQGVGELQHNAQDLLHAGRK